MLFINYEIIKVIQSLKWIFLFLQQFEYFKIMSVCDVDLKFENDNSSEADSDVETNKNIFETINKRSKLIPPNHPLA